ncbi:hypothetical protein [Andreprevotia chitinilytica]|uniref:hypothetical protein n=1 Tax=Andreprevotia chitinilytica TaxID=396808 RepID=UPI00054F2833|nr:hypothetical protein [Andreprevotia chitinilytica]
MKQSQEKLDKWAVKSLLRREAMMRPPRQWTKAGKSPSAQMQSMPQKLQLRQTLITEFGSVAKVVRARPFGKPVIPLPKSGFSSYQPTLEQWKAHRFGAKALKNTLNAKNPKVSKGEFDKKGIYSRWRMPQRKHKFGGSGLDEMTRTAFARDTLAALHKAAIPGLSLIKSAQLLSMNRGNTDALVWYKGNEIGGHPGGLREAPNSDKGVTHGHGSLDNARAKAAKTEFQQLLPNLQKARPGDVYNAIGRVNMRTEVETVAHMSMQYQETMTKPRPSPKSVYHAQFGDLSNKGNFEQMARYMHNHREKQKWDTAGKLMRHDLQGHVPQVMQDYLKRAKGDHHLARQMFQHAATRQVKPETRVNSANTSQAEHVPNTTTLRDAPKRNRALSLPRISFQK